MIRVNPTIPPDCAAVGSIYWDDNPAILGEDMLEVTLPYGRLVSCGWYPEGDPAGCFRITVSEGFEELRRVETKSIFDARSKVEQLCREFSAPVLRLSDTAASGRFVVEC
jgi:hypothetical protein